jgi:hypothetical protein
MFPTISFTSLLSLFTHGVRVCFPTQSCISSWPSMPSFSWTEHKIFTTYPWKSGTSVVGHGVSGPWAVTQMLGLTHHLSAWA